MEIKASTQITLAKIIDVEAIHRFYKLESSESEKPSKPTSYPPTDWSNEEPGYVSGSTNVLYIVDCTVYSNDSFEYSEVSKSSSYEAAKDAWNKAQEAQTTLSNMHLGGRNLLVGTGTPVTHTGTGGVGQNTSLYETSLYYRSLSQLSGESLTLSFEWDTDATGGSFVITLNDIDNTTISNTITISSSVMSGTDSKTIIATSVFDTADYTGVKLVSNDISGNVTIKNMKWERGNKSTDWSPAPEDTDERFSDVETRITDAETTITNNQHEITLRATTDTVTDISNKANDLDKALEDAKILIQENRDAIATLTDRDFKVEFTTITNQIESVNGDLNAYKQEIGNWMRFDADGNLVLGATKVAGQDSYELKLTKNRISFMLNDNEVAYISSNQLYITNSTVVQNLRIGRFVWEVRGNGNLGLVYR